MVDDIGCCSCWLSCALWCCVLAVCSCVCVFVWLLLYDLTMTSCVDCVVIVGALCYDDMCDDMLVYCWFVYGKFVVVTLVIVIHVVHCCMFEYYNGIVWLCGVDHHALHCVYHCGWSALMIMLLMTHCVVCCICW